MSVEVKIKQKLFSKKINITDVIESSGILFGIHDENFVILPGEVGKDLVLFYKDHVARGIGTEMKVHNLNFTLNLPTSVEEIIDFYDLIDLACKLAKVNTYIKDGVTVNVNDREKLIKETIEGSLAGLQSIKNSVEKNHDAVFIFGAFNPIAIGQKELEEIDGKLENFSNLLQRLQTMKAYYSQKIIYQIDNKYVGVYTTPPSMSVVVPLEHYALMCYVEISEWYVRFSKEGIIKYDDFINNIGEKEYYDAKHVIVKVTQEKVDELLEKYKVDLFKKDK